MRHSWHPVFFIQRETPQLLFLSLTHILGGRETEKLPAALPFFIEFSGQKAMLNLGLWGDSTCGGNLFSFSFIYCMVQVFSVISNPAYICRVLTSSRMLRERGHLPFEEQIDIPSGVFRFSHVKRNVLNPVFPAVQPHEKIESSTLLPSSCLGQTD